MSDDLVKRLRSKIIIHTDAAVWMLEAADRIGELEAKLALAADELTNAEMQLQYAADYWDEVCNDAARAPFSVAAKKARTTIAELKETRHE